MANSKDDDDTEIRALVSRAQGGDEAALQKLLETHRTTISSTLVACGVRNRDTAFDLAQDVALRVRCSITELEAPRAFSAWLRRITGNAARDHLRRMAIRREEALEDAILPRAADDPHRDVERRTEVRLMLSALREEDRDLVRLLVAQADGASVAELALHAKLTPGALKMRLSRARKRLRRRLSELTGGGI